MSDGEAKLKNDEMAVKKAEANRKKKADEEAKLTTDTKKTAQEYRDLKVAESNKEGTHNLNSSLEEVQAKEIQRIEKKHPELVGKTPDEINKMSVQWQKAQIENSFKASDIEMMHGLNEKKMALKKREDKYGAKKKEYEVQVNKAEQASIAQINAAYPGVENATKRASLIKEVKESSKRMWKEFDFKGKNIRQNEKHIAKMKKEINDIETQSDSYRQAASGFGEKITEGNRLVYYQRQQAKVKAEQVQYQKSPDYLNTLAKEFELEELAGKTVRAAKATKTAKNKRDLAEQKHKKSVEDIAQARKEFVDMRKNYAKAASHAKKVREMLKNQRAKIESERATRRAQTGILLSIDNLVARIERSIINKQNKQSWHDLQKGIWTIARTYLSTLLSSNAVEYPERSKEVKELKSELDRITKKLWEHINKGPIIVNPRYYVPNKAEDGYKMLKKMIQELFVNKENRNAVYFDDLILYVDVLLEAHQQNKIARQNLGLVIK